MSIMPTASPFRIGPKHEAALAGNEAFVAIQKHLRRQEKGMNAPSFCTLHRHCCSSDEQASFRLHRDIIHAVLLPLFLLHNQASRIASRALPPQKAATELECAFRSDARSAYTWLHCVISEEHDWYMTARCPACIVLHVFHSEPTIRFVAVACMLSDHREHRDLLDPTRQLPNFGFWLDALETAVREDPLWGGDCWPEIEYRASSLTDSVRELALQCLDRARSAPADQMAIRTATTTTATGSSSSSVPTPSVAVSSARYPLQAIALKPSSFARRQIKMTREEEKWVASLAVSYYLQLRWNERAQALSNRAGVHVLRRGLRRRSITS